MEETHGSCIVKREQVLIMDNGSALLSSAVALEFH